MNDRFGQLNERAGWVGGPESGSKLPHSKTLRESGSGAGHRGREGAEFTIRRVEFPRTDKVSDLIGNSELVLGVGEERVVNMWMGYLPILADKKSFWRCGKFPLSLREISVPQIHADGLRWETGVGSFPIRTNSRLPGLSAFVFIRVHSWLNSCTPMPLRVLIAPDKFKGTLSAPAAARAIARGWRRVRSGDSLELFPFSDGGDGFGELLGAQLGAKTQCVTTVDAAHRRCQADWWWLRREKTAIIESAKVIGLARLPRGRFHPFELDTFGLGAVIEAAVDHGARRCIIGIGGSATNDGGFGLARALGWEFLDRRGDPINSWTQLHTLARICAPRRKRPFRALTVAVDVRNPLLGAHGCTRVFGPQKGLRKSDFATAERSLRRLAAVVADQFGHDSASEPGAGAAGGLGFGLRAFLGARLAPGFELFARQTRLMSHLRSADLVITGEGAIDRQTLMGKGVGQLGGWCAERRIPRIALAGQVLVPNKSRTFTDTRALTDLTSLKNALARPAYWLERLAGQFARDMSNTPDGITIAPALPDE